jgi:hypothetical protein
METMFLQNVGIYRRVYTAPNPRRISPSSSSSLSWKHQISQQRFSLYVCGNVYIWCVSFLFHFTSNAVSSITRLVHYRVQIRKVFYLRNLLEFVYRIGPTCFLLLDNRQWLPLLFSFRKVSGSNLVPEKGFLYLDFSCFTSVPPGKYRDSTVN